MEAKYLFLIFFLGLATISCKLTDNTDPSLNLDFEKVEHGMPTGWYLRYPQGDYSVSLDSVDVTSGKYSLAMETVSDTGLFQVVAFTLPHHYSGNKVTLSGHIKTENITGQVGGLWLEIKSNFPNDRRALQRLKGTSDWTRYEVTLDMNPAKAQQIVIGGVLGGIGKVWLDDLKITIDGKDINRVRPYESQPPRAREDKEFDKGSNLIFPELTGQRIADLELLGRIWGFLKYHHPAVATGDYNWDYELFRMLPAYLNTENPSRRDKILTQWIKKYGRIVTYTTSHPTLDSAFIKPDHSWIQKSDMDEK